MFLSEYDGRDSTGNSSGVGSSALGSTSSPTTALPGPAPNTAGPHSKDWMNKLDPRVDAKPATSTDASLESSKPYYSGEKSTEADKKDHHVGRDAALAGGAGGAAYEAEKHHKHDKDLTQAERDAKKEHKHELKEEKKHHAAEKKEHQHALAAEKKEHRQELKDEKKHEHDDKSHLGRDAALAGGAGGAAYEAEKHHKNKEIDETQGKESHLGRDAALAGGVSGAAVGGTTMWDKLHKPTETTEPQGSVHSGTLAGTGTGYSDNIPSEARGATETSGDHHYGRDAALGGGALGAGGLAAHEHKKHEQPSTTGTSSSAEYPSTTGSSTTGPSTTTGEHHYGRDAALGGAALGAGGLAEHEHKKHDTAGTTTGAAEGARKGSVTGSGRSAYDPDFARAEL
jgi:hypothetical protein